ncbi:vitamin B12-dependent ribonucleotide reductase [Pseudogemmobacter faecipullorum]|uniref:Vitamin B12-dependent ribonucleotide reductase n=1 Tax=Pseudogemmobacter faecipullorum TaxID=2755041 RepID=A0ABS8CLP1_9RHOB|nr:vitamin B12-dependent ribonucleotide reductase [Pseudogemmobacter faecipullorum]
MKLDRMFTEGTAMPLAGISFVTRRIAHYAPSGLCSFESDSVEVPDSWSQSAADMLAQRFFCRNAVPVALKPVPEPGVPDFLWRSVADEAALAQLPAAARYTCESTAAQVFDRLAGAWSWQGWHLGLFADAAEARIFQDEIRYMLARQMAAPAAPQWAATGLWWAYGIGAGEAAGFAAGPCSGESRPAAPGQPMLYQAMIRSSAAPEGLSQATALASGVDISAHKDPMAVLRRVGAVLPRGTDRPRRAMQLACAISHDWAGALIGWKLREEQKAASLIAGSKAIEAGLNAILAAVATATTTGAATGAGEAEEGGAAGAVAAADPARNPALQAALRAAERAYIPEAYIARALDYAAQGFTSLSFPGWEQDWDSELWDQVAGRDVSLALRLDPAFLAARAKGGAAAERWQEIGEAVWSCGDQSLLFQGQIDAWHTCPESGAIGAATPMGDHLFLAETGALQAGLNLAAFLRAGQFDAPGFAHAVRLWTLVLEISTTLSAAPSPESAAQIADFRPLGLGFTNLGALLMRMGLAYDSAQGRSFCAALTAVLTGQAYLTSAELAAKLGAFRGFDANRASMLAVIARHRAAAYGLAGDGSQPQPPVLSAADCPDPGLAALARSLWDQVVAAGAAHGFRNAQVSAIGPSGAISLLMDCETTGIEPDSAQVKYYARGGGGALRGLNPSVSAGLGALGYSGDEIAAIRAYALGSQTLREAPYINHASLCRLGFGPDELARLEAALPGCYDLRFIFTPWVLGEAFCLDHLAMPSAALQDPGFDLLAHLGFSGPEIAAASAHICGHLTIAGAPGLRDSDLQVFDCAMSCGASGRPALSIESQLRMMAAAQPFLSGGIGRIITLPHQITIAALLAAVALAHDLGLKGISFYREGSKLSHPLARDLLAGLDPQDSDRVVSLPERARVLAGRLSTLAPPPGRSARESLPSRRKGYTRKARIGGHKVWLRSGEYEDGRPGELFITMGAEGDALRAMMSHFAIAVSTGLQYGVPLEEFVDAFVRPAGQGGPGGSDAAGAGAVLDFIFRDLAVSYLDRADLAPRPAPGAAGQASDGAEGDDAGAPAEGALDLLRAIAATGTLRPGSSRAGW